jgi:hypothetical protein
MGAKRKGLRSEGRGGKFEENMSRTHFLSNIRHCQAVGHAIGWVPSGGESVAGNSSMLPLNGA